VGPLTLLILDEEDMLVESAMYLRTPNNKTLVNSNNKQVLDYQIKHKIISIITILFFFEQANFY
jgi:uncharacterized Tic20 family protein